MPRDYRAVAPKAYTHFENLYLGNETSNFNKIYTDGTRYVGEPKPHERGPLPLFPRIDISRAVYKTTLAKIAYLAILPGMEQPEYTLHMDFYGCIRD